MAAHAQQPQTPVVAFINGGAADAATRYLAAFQKGLREAGYVEGQNITVEYYWLDGRYEGIPALMADLVRRQVALIATPGSNVAAVAAKAATATIPIVFGSADDPVKLGLVASFARPGGNGTGVNFFAYEVTTKQLGLLKELVPRRLALPSFAHPRAATRRPASRRHRFDHNAGDGRGQGDNRQSCRWSPIDGTQIYSPHPGVDFIPARAARLTLSGYTARASPSKGRLMRYTVPGSTLNTT